MDSGGSPVSPVSPDSVDSVGPRCALKIVALRLRFQRTWNRIHGSAFEAGRALRLKFIENLMENCIDAGFLDCLEIKNSSLARLCDTDRCNFAREHEIGGISLP